MCGWRERGGGDNDKFLQKRLRLSSVTTRNPHRKRRFPRKHLSEALLNRHSNRLLQELEHHLPSHDPEEPRRLPTALGSHFGRDCATPALCPSMSSATSSLRPCLTARVRSVSTMPVRKTPSIQKMQTQSLHSDPSLSAKRESCDPNRNVCNPRKPIQSHCDPYVHKAKANLGAEDKSVDEKAGNLKSGDRSERPRLCDVGVH